MSDVTLEAVYYPWITNVESEERDGKLPLALADGKFTDEAVLHAAMDKPENSEEVKMSVSLSGTELSNGDAVPIRLLNTVGKGAQVFLIKDGGREKLNARESGSYLLFEMNGAEGSFVIQPGQDSVIVIVIAAAAALVLVLIIVITIKRGKNKKAAAEKEKKTDAKAKKKGKSN